MLNMYSMINCPQLSHAGGVPLSIRLDSVGKSYPTFSLGPISLTLEPGCILGFVGPNGAGKTTTLKIIMGLVRSDSGTIRILDEEIDRRQGSWKSEVGYVAEDNAFYEGWKGSQILEVHARFHRNWCMDRAEKLAKRLELNLEKRARQLSRGNRIKLALVRALAHQPRFLILDEPTSGLDPVTRNEVLEILLEYASSGERSVLFSTHIIPDIARISDLVTFIKNGRITKSGTPFDITESWRKIRFSFPFDKIDLPGVVSHKVEDHLHLVVTTEFEQARKSLEKAGAMIRDINRLSLDEAAVYILKGDPSCSS